MMTPQRRTHAAHTALGRLKRGAGTTKRPAKQGDTAGQQTDGTGRTDWSRHALLDGKPRLSEAFKPLLNA